MTKSLMHMISCDNKEFSDESKAQPSKHFSTKTLEFISTHCKYACLGETPAFDEALYKQMWVDTKLSKSGRDQG